MECCFEIFKTWTCFIQTPAHSVSKHVAFSNLLNDIFLFPVKSSYGQARKMCLTFGKINEMKILKLTIAHCIWQQWITQWYRNEISLKTLRRKKISWFFFSVIALNFVMQIKMTLGSLRDFRSRGLIGYLITILCNSRTESDQRKHFSINNQAKHFSLTTKNHIVLQKCFLSCHLRLNFICAPPTQMATSILNFDNLL